MHKWFVFILLGLCIPSFSQVKVEKYQLENGLTILLYPSRHAPTVACRLFFTTGSIHEAPGNTGIAHMLEHMLFKGTKKVGITDSLKDSIYLDKIDQIMAKYQQTKDSATKSDLWNQYQQLMNEHRNYFIKDELWGAFKQEGGTGLNAFTSDLMTAYFVNLPRNKVELFLWLESDRMQNAVLREFYPERDVVMEERRMRYEDTPLGRYFESLNGLFYEAHPYRLPTIGYASDIANYTREMAEQHFKDYYKPNNAILVLAGDINTSEILPKIKEYFGSIPKGKDHKPVVTREPTPVGEKRLTVYKNNAQPRLDILFLTPGIPHEDLYALEILQGVLSGKSGRLYTSLVNKEKLVLDASAGNQMQIHHSSFYLSFDLEPKIPLEKVEKKLWTIIDELKEKPISERELTRVRNQVLTASQKQLQDLDHLATQLAFYEMYGTWEYINIIPEEIQKVTTEQVMQVAKKYLIRNQSTVGVVLPEESKL